MTTEVMASSDTSTNPRVSLPPNQVHPSAGWGTARELSAATPGRGDSSCRTMTRTLLGSVTSKRVGGPVHSRRNPASVQILAAGSARASSSTRGKASASLIRCTRKSRAAGAATRWPEVVTSGKTARTPPSTRADQGHRGFERESSGECRMTSTPRPPTAAARSPYSARTANRPHDHHPARRFAHPGIIERAPRLERVDGRIARLMTSTVIFQLHLFL